MRFFPSLLHGRLRRRGCAGRITTALLVLWPALGIVPAAMGAAATLTSPVATAPATAAAPAGEYGRLVTELAGPDMEGRGAGTAGLDKARDRLVAWFREAGLQPAFGASYLQAVPLPVAGKVKGQSLAILKADGQATRQGKLLEDFSALGFSTAGEFDAPVVLVGYGVVNDSRRYNSYGGVPEDDGPVQGKVAVAFRYEPQDPNGRSLWASAGRPWSASAGLQAKAAWAARHGAKALLVVNPPSQEPNEPLQPSDRSAGGTPSKIPIIRVSGGFLKALLVAAGRPADDAALQELQRQADQGRDRPQVLNGVRLKGKVQVESARAVGHNVVGILPGAGSLADEFVLIGAHYDHLGYGAYGAMAPSGEVFFGADDNASGTAGLVILARRLARVDASAARRAVVVAAFTGEELGLIGSAHLARHKGDLSIRGRLTAMLNLDMIGRMRENRLHVYGADSGAGMRDLLQRAGKAAGADLRLYRSVGISDQSWFYTLTKVPALHFYTGGHGDYHTPRDTADRINAPGAIRVLDVAESVVRELTTRPQPLAYVSPEAGGNVIGGKGAFLGVAPDPMADDGQGCVLMTVVPGTAAERAGLQAGDVITAWNGQVLPNYEALLEAVARCKVGDKVRLKVRREDTTLDVEVQLGRRGS